MGAKSRGSRLSDFIEALDKHCGEKCDGSKSSVMLFYMRALVVEARSRNILLESLVDKLDDIESGIGDLRDVK